MRKFDEKLYASTLRASVCSLLIGSAAMVAPNAYAQEAQDQASEEVAAEEIIITGSRISRAGIDTLQPAVSVDSDFIDDRGYTNVAEALNDLPAFGLPTDNRGGQGAQTLGQNFVNAFNLGSQRTLTLINGRRTVGQNTPSGAGVSGLQVDLNIIPTALIERVETIFVGGAPIYGTDAIAGTVNVILKKDYEGFSADAQYGIDQRGNSENFRVRGLWGVNSGDGRGNVTLSAEYNTQNAVDARDLEPLRRQFGFCESGIIDPESEFDFLPCDDSANVFQVPNPGIAIVGQALPTADAFANGSTGSQARTISTSFGNALLNPNGDPLTFDPDGNLVPIGDLFGTPRSIFFSQGANGFDSPFVIGLDETNTAISPLDRWIINGTGRYEITESTSVFLEALYARSEATDTNNQPPFFTEFFAGSGFGSIAIDVNDNPFISDQLRNTLNANFDRIDAENMQAVADSIVNNAEDIANGVDPDAREFRDVLAFVPVNRDSFAVSRSGIDLVQGAPNFRSQDVYRFVAGFDGDVEFLGTSWAWDTAFTFGETNSLTRQSVLNARRHALALDAVVDPDTGEAVCRASLEGVEDGFENSFPTSANPGDNDVAGCFALNPFGLQDLTAEQRDYLIQQEFQSVKIRQLVYEANINGDLIDLPAGPLAIAAGFAHRREQGRFLGDLATRTAVRNFDDPTPAVSGKFNTTEFYGETLIPLITDGEGLPFDVPFISSLQIEAALRFVDNNIAGNDVTWTAGGRLRPNLPFIEDSIQFRGNFTQSIRTPSIPELFQPRTAISTFASDPCDERFIDGGPNPANRAANCQAQVDSLIAGGVLPTGFSLDGFRSLIVNRSDRGFTGGNPDLDNEIADSWTVGAVIQPNFLPGFTLEVDWTSIQVNGAITSLSGTQLLNACFDSDDITTAEACTLFERDADFQVRNPELNLLNAATREFAGLVANVSYEFDGEDLHESIPGSFRVFGNFYHTAKQEIVVSGGDLNVNTGERFNERLRFQLNLAYNYEKLGFLWQTRHLGGYNINAQESDTQRPQANRFVDPSRIHNLTLNYQLSDNIRLQGIVNNVFDNTDAPDRLRSSGGNDVNTDDVVGRRFVFSVKADF